MLTKGVNSIALIFFAMLMCIGTAKAQVKREQKEMGVIDARTLNFSQERLPLSGYWTFFQGQLLAPNDIAVERGAFVYFPKLFNNIDFNGNGIGCATFNLLVLVPDSMHNFSLEIPQLYNAYKLWVNNELVASAGEVGTTKEATIPKWCYKRVSFGTKTDTLNITLQVANFHHHKGGAKEIIYLGTPEKISSHWTWAYGINWTMIIFLFLEAVIFTFIYLKQPDKKAVLYFSLLCLAWSFRGAFSNLYPVITIFPDFNWNILLKVEYITLYLGIIFSILFLDELFRNLRSRVITFLLVSINIFFIFFTLFSLPLAFSRWVDVYVAVAGITIGYGSIIVIRALLFEQAGAWFLLVSLLLGAVVFGYDIVAYGSAAGYNMIFLHIGYILIFTLVTISLLFHLQIFKSNMRQSDVLTYNEMFKKEEVIKK
jgi:hypothetical protein